jgi:predicted nucleic acid-binding protein
MIIAVDINVLLDVFQNRQPHYAASAGVMNLVMQGTLKGVCPSHALTTLYYLARRHGTQADAESAIDSVFQHFEIVSLDHAGWQTVRHLPFADFEDAAVSVTAAKANAAFIITRNEADFAQSSVPAIAPSAFLGRFAVAPSSTP